MAKKELPIGTKNGCYTIIDGFNAYYKEVTIKKIEDLKQEKFLKGEKTNNNFDSIETYDFWIKKSKSYKKYKCQCKCGRVEYLSEDLLLRKKWRDCGEQCELRKKRQQKYRDACPKEKHPSYDLDLLNSYFESLEIIECIDDNFEDEPILYSKKKLGDGVCYIYKLYKCRCHICGKEYHFKSSDFVIRKDMYGKRAKDGYYSDTYCNCHKISSFQWRTLKIFHEYNIKYKVEVSFPDLYGIENKNLLRFDFAIFNDENKIKFLIECQGEQHYKPSYEFGGNKAFESQIKNDQLKRDFAKQNNIPLIEIPYTCNSYDDEVIFLKKLDIIK